MGRWLGIDHGLKVLGVAVSDPTGLLARPLTVLHRRSKTEDFAALARLAAEHQVEGIVVGLPDQPGAERPKQAMSVRRWAAQLAAAGPLPVWLWDEQFSSSEAARLLDEGGQRRAPGARIDDAAAAVILQSFLDARRDNPDAGERVFPPRA
mgnify:CR=1 FL=1